MSSAVQHRLARSMLEWTDLGCAIDSCMWPGNMDDSFNMPIYAEEKDDILANASIHLVISSFEENLGLIILFHTRDLIRNMLPPQLVRWPSFFHHFMLCFLRASLISRVYLGSII
jgi:hypothetical protein